MFVLIADQEDSRREADRVPALLEALAPLPLLRAPERTAGDEVEMLAEDAGTALAAVLALLELEGWSIGLGIGTVERPLPASVRSARGPAFLAARDAVEAARRTSEVPIAIRAQDERRREETGELQALLRLIGWMIRGRSPGQWRVVHVLREDPEATQAQIAARLGVAQPTVSKALKTSGWREEHAAHPLARRLLALIDLTEARA